MKYIIAFLCFPMLLFSQQGNEKFKTPDIIPPSPTVANLMHFEEVPVDFYTGQADINIPLHSKKLSTDITLPIALKYNTQGIKCTERSGWTGTGWSLEAGGTISRTVRGLPDDLNKPPGSNGGGTGIHNLPSDEYLSFQWLSDLEKNKYMWNVGGTSNIKYDSQPDLYQFSILGATGRFIVLRNGLSLVPILLTKDQRVKIQITQGSNYSITGFVIIDANGNRYIFGGSSATEETTYAPRSISYPLTGEVAPDLQTPYGEYTYKSAWHLTKITTSNPSIELANFTYKNSQEQYESYINRTEYKFIDLLAWEDYYTGSEQTNPYIGANTAAFKPRLVTSWGITTVQTRKLDSIVFMDKTKVKFLSATTGHPENGGAKLNEIELYDAYNYKLKQYSFIHATTTAIAGVGETMEPRFWIIGINEVATDEPSKILKYRFDYFEKEKLPGFGPADPWGYAHSDFRVAGRGYDLDMFKRGLLTKIVYPTGGVKEFVYEPHMFSYEGSNLISTDYSDTNPYNSFGGNIYKDFNVVNNNLPGYSNVFHIPYAQTVSMNINVTGESSTNNPMTNEIEYGREYYAVFIYKTNSSGVIIGSPLSYTTNQAYHAISLGEGYYKYTIKYGTALDPADDQYLNARVTVQYSGQDQGNGYDQMIVGGGPRIKEILFKENELATQNKKRIMYFYNELRPDETIPKNKGEYIVSPNLPHVKSSGSVDALMGSLLKEYSYNHKAFIVNSNGQCLPGTTTDGLTIGYTVTTNEPNVELTKGGYVGYKFVRVREVGAGYTAYTYTNPQDFPLDPAYFSYPFKPRPDLDYKRGLLLKKQVYDERGKILEETMNDIATGYEYIEQNVQLYAGQNIKLYQLNEIPCPWTKYYSNYTLYNNGTPTQTEQLPCGYTADQAHCGAGSPLPAPFSFSPLELKATIARLKKSLKKEYFYEGETQLVTETTTEYTYNDSNNQIASEKKTVKEGLETNTYETRYEYPVGEYTTTLFDVPEDENDPQEDERAVINFMKLDTVNMINKPIVVATYRNNEPLQKVINKYKLFEGVPQIKEIESIKDAGTNGDDRVVFSKYDAVGNPLEVSMKGGVVTCYIWGYDGTLPIAKIEGITSYTAMETALPQHFIRDELQKLSNALTYNEQQLTINLDLLRNYLPGAMVTTLIHDPAKGVERVTDPRGNFFTYKYDDMGRLVWIKDKDGNFVSEHFYNYRPEIQEED